MPRSLLRAASATALVFSFLTAALAAEAPRKNFNVPAGAAGETLKQFAVQAGREIVFAPEAIGKVPTKAVNGHLTPREALDLMLADSGLIMSQDAKTGAFAVRRGSLAPSEKKEAARAEVTPVARVASGTTAGGDDHIVEMSPFVVDSQRDTGYQATSTLAGTRLNTPIQDLGAAISVYTKDFLDDIGATSSADLLVYATGMEAAGAGGNFSGAPMHYDAASAGDEVPEATRVDPQGTSRTRGLAAPSFTRNFFITDIPFDAYNTDRVTVNRGPNAALFGVGSPAGVVETSLLRADPRRNTNKVVMRYGNNDSLRGSVDFNRVLVDEKLAVRIAALHDRERFNQRPAFEEKKRIYGALTFEPYKSTSLRTNFESGRTRANRPITVLPYNSIPAAWYAAGRPGYDWTYYDDPARNPSAQAQIAGSGDAAPAAVMGNNLLLDKVTLVYATPSAATPAYAFRSTTPSTTGTDANAVKAQLFHPLVNRDLGADGIRHFATYNIFDLPGSFWTGTNVLPGQQPNQKPAGIKRQGFTDLSAFDFKNQMIDETSSQEQSFHAFNISLEQRAWEDRVGIELAYDAQRSDRRSKNSFLSAPNANQVRVDASVTLPNGQPNPNYGRPFVQSGHQGWTNYFTQRESKRATAYLKYDFKEAGIAWGQWLGRHTLTGLYETAAAEKIQYNHRLATDGAAARAIGGPINVENRRPALLVYLGPSVIGNNNPLRLEAIRIPEMTAGPLAVPVNYFVRAANATDPGDFVNAPGSFVDILGYVVAQPNREVIKSQAAVLQSYWLQSHLITLVGWRRDKDYFIAQSIAWKPNPADPNDPGKVHFGFEDFSFPSTPPFNVGEDITSYGAVLRWPRKLFKLPAGTDFSVFYNRSENFTPVGGRVNGFGEGLASPRGKTDEYGFAFSAFGEKLVLRVNRFENAIKDASYASTTFSSATNISMISTVRDFWALEANTNPHLAAMRNADIELLFSPLPANYRDLWGLKITGAAPRIAASSFANLAGATDTTDYTAKGTEFELVFNPTPNWRILTNLAKQETVKSNVLPFTKRFIALMEPIWRQLAGRPRGNYPLGWQPGDPLPANVTTFGAYLDTYVFVPFATELANEGVASAEQRKWRANLVTNYTFRRGSIFGEQLKGWGVGGAVRWQDKLGMGYPTTRNPDTSVNIDIAHPYYAPAETNVDAWISYSRKLWGNRIDWKVQLNVQNLIRDRELIPLSAQPWGEVATVRLAPERRWYLTNTFSF